MVESLPVAVSAVTHHSEVKTGTCPHPSHGENSRRVSSFPAELNPNAELVG